MKKLILALLTVAFIAPKGFSQDVNTVQPSIMVIPFVKEGQDIRTIIDDSPILRICMTKVKEGFDNRGFTTVDFRAKLKAAMASQGMEMDNQSSIKQQIIEMSGADIYVELDGSYHPSSSGNSVTMTLNAYDAFSGQAMGSKVGESGKFYTDDYGKLASKAVEKCIDPFLDAMNTKFADIVENGRTVVVNIGFDEMSEYSMDDEVGEDELPLSDALELWFEENAYKNDYHIQGVTSTKAIYDAVKIPLRDPSGKNYRATKFALKLYLYIKKDLGMSCSKDVNGTTIYIKIK